MKRMLAMVVLLFALMGAASAVDFAVEGHVFSGGNIGADYSGYQGVVVGAGAYFNLNLLGGFGFQGEVNVITKKLAYNDNVVTFTNYEILDIPMMIWYNLTLGRIALGLGAGLNFSATDYYVNDASKSGVNIGVAGGLNFKFLIGEHFGIVLGAHSVFDLLPSVVCNEDGESRSYYLTESSYTRKSVYGRLGLEFRF